LTKNQYRLIKCDTEGTHYELKLQKDFVMKLDMDDLKFTQEYAWCAKKGDMREDIMRFKVTEKTLNHINKLTAVFFLEAQALLWVF
jgi:hypothetical protein